MNRSVKKSVDQEFTDFSTLLLGTKAVPNFGGYILLVCRLKSRKYGLDVIGMQDRNPKIRAWPY